MQPYRNVATTQFLPIYWNCEQCLCENCLKSPHQESSSCVDNTQKPSFSIESLLSRKDGPKTDQCMVSPSLKMNGVPSSTTRQLPNDATELLHGYLAHFRHPPSFAQVPLFGRGNFHANGTLLARSDETDWSIEKPKRMRTIFTVEQLERLEREFTRQQYMVGGQRFYLSKELGLTETQVKVWFQNRRIKWRKQLIEQQRSKVRYQKEPSISAREENDCS
ncbi:unnamed protein product [Porites evermanni]|uniref:Homeobox domain-containing protein n=1 Tax=Porites evermanni TaxID=104178 RepID=A0ABN8S853_9CNID|nr:unnamed protein product [Porites evermanni]